MTPQQRAQHTLAEVLRVAAGDALADFEDALIREIAGRRACFGDAAVISQLEDDVLAVAIESMERRIASLVAANQIAFLEACRRATAVAGGPW